MAIVTDLLHVLGLDTSPTAPIVSAANRSALIWPTPLAPIAQGTVAAASATLDRTAAPQPRAVAFSAPEMTLRGLGQMIHDALLQVPSPPQPIPDAVTLSRAVLAYNDDALDLANVVKVLSATVPGPLRLFPAWLTGVAIRMPIEVSTGGGLVTDIAFWASLAAKADAAWDSLLDMVPQPLTIPDHDSDLSWANGIITANPDLASTAAERRTALLANPSAALYQTLTLLNTPSTADQLTLATALASALAADELQLLATTMPGAVVLRALYRRLAAGASLPGHDATLDAAITALNAALGLPGTTAADLTVTTPSVVPAELPVSPGWTTRAPSKRGVFDTNGEVLGGRHSLVHGRDLYGGKLGVYDGYRGPAYIGNADFMVATYAAAHAQDVSAGKDARTLARLEIIKAIANNEGYLDAARLQDRAMLSVGLQQWSVHVDDELSVLLYRYAQANPDDYDTVYGSYGLRLQLVDNWPGGATGFPAGTPRTVALQRAVPDAPNLAMPAPQDQSLPDGERLSFFGGAPVTGGGGVHYQFDTTPWAAYSRSAVRCAKSMQLWEITFALMRFDRILSENRTWTKNGTTFHINDLITSKQGAAQVLDQHINAPGHLQKDVQKALDAADAVPTGGPTPTWLTAVESSYLTVMRYGSSDLKYDHTVPGPNGPVLIPGRQDNIKREHLDPAPHSFDGGW